MASADINVRIPTRIRVSEGITKNLGDFNSFRYDASVELDVEAGETVEEAYERAYALANAEVEKRLTEVEADLASD